MNTDGPKKPFRAVFFSLGRFEREYIRKTDALAQNGDKEFTPMLIEARLTPQTVSLCHGAKAVSVFVNDVVNQEVLADLKDMGVGLVALRCAGFDNVDVMEAQRLGIQVVRVPDYSPYAVAEFTITMMMCLNRKIHKAVMRTRESNFSLGGLLGFDMKGKTIGIIGLGKIGLIVGKILLGFGCTVIAYDVYHRREVKELGIRYVDLFEIFSKSDIITLHCPLVPATKHIINAEAVMRMKKGVMLVNTSRGGLIDNAAVISGLKARIIGALGMDVFEGEDELFFEDLSGSIIENDAFTRLITFPNVMVTGHMAFLTETALSNIFASTVKSINDFGKGLPLKNAIVPPSVKNSVEE